VTGDQPEESARRAADILLSPLLALDELGFLAQIRVTYSAKPNGRSHSPSCLQRGKNAAESATASLTDFRVHLHHERACRTCGGADLPELSPEQRADVSRLAQLLPDREEEARREAEAERAAAARVRAADVIDERASRILNGWDWGLREERRRAEGRSAGTLTAMTNCSEGQKCGAKAEVSFDPHTLEVRFKCLVDQTHSWMAGSDDDSWELWKYSAEVRYDALALIAPAIADGDDSWIQVYGTRAHDHRTTIEALRAFDEVNPQPTGLCLNVRCGLCDRPMPLYESDPGSKIPPGYSCDHRHADGLYHHVDKANVDDVVDRLLHRRLNGRFRWALAAELAPAAKSLAAYVDYLKAKIETYDVHIGVAKADRSLSRRRARLTLQLEQVRAIQEQGVFAVAELDMFVRSPWRAASSHGRESFTDLGRALLVERVVCHREDIQVVTRLDEDTALHRKLRAEELREQIAAAQADLQELEEELVELGESAPDRLESR
jgi:hypothetical protein